MGFQKACDVALDDELDLEQVYEDQDPDVFIRSGVKRGASHGASCADSGQTAAPANKDGVRLQAS